jgi:hypothetical protein
MADPAYIDPDTNVLTDGEAWVGLNTTTLGSDTATVTFKSGFDDTDTDVGGVQAWDQYMDLVIVSYARGAVAVVTAQLDMQLNADTGSNYAKQRIEGSGSAAYAASWGSATSHMLGVLPCANATANIFMSSVTTLFDINSGKYKSGLSQAATDLDGSTSGRVQLWGLTWKSQTPITQIKLYDATGAGDLAAGSSFSLFGVLPRMVA